MDMKSAGESAFFDVLLRYSQEGDETRRRALERELWSTYGAERAVLVLDMSGFSSLTSRYGIVHYLSMVRRMQLTAEPIVRGFGGTLVKFEADNCFAMFADAAAAVRAAVALNRAFDAANTMTPDELDIRVSCGIDVGPILVVENRDFFGDPVNRACKLGEDLAEAGEILVTLDAMKQVEAQAGFEIEPRSYRIAGIAIEACAVRLREA
jgi:class 3 adenylate cyclase